MMLQNKLAERTKLLSQLEQAKMQEQVSKSLNQMSELAAPGNTPSLEEVRDKIEKRYTTALGSAELAQNSVQGRMMEVQASTTEMAGPVAAGADPRVDGRRLGHAAGHQRFEHQLVGTHGEHPGRDRAAGRPGAEGERRRPTEPVPSAAGRCRCDAWAGASTS